MEMKLAPLFTLPDEQGRAVSLADFKGKKNVLLVFYPGDLTPGCSMQLSEIRDDWAKFNARDTVVFGINHAESDSHAAFIKKCSLPFHLLTDAGRTVSTRYGATKKFRNVRVITRTVIVVNTDGKIIYEKHGRPKNMEILQAIKT
ncbi:MAG: peroxiredoxin [Patescibacteria group bacterium]